MNASKRRMQDRKSRVRIRKVGRVCWMLIALLYFHCYLRCSQPNAPDVYRGIAVSLSPEAVASNLTFAKLNNFIKRSSQLI